MDLRRACTGIGAVPPQRRVSCEAKAPEAFTTTPAPTLRGGSPGDSICTVLMRLESVWLKPKPETWPFTSSTPKLCPRGEIKLGIKKEGVCMVAFADSYV